MWASSLMLKIAIELDYMTVTIPGAEHMLTIIVRKTQSYQTTVLCKSRFILRTDILRQIYPIIVKRDRIVQDESTNADPDITAAGRISELVPQPISATFALQPPPFQPRLQYLNLAGLSLVPKHSYSLTAITRSRLRQSRNDWQTKGS